MLNLDNVYLLGHFVLSIANVQNGLEFMFNLFKTSGIDTSLPQLCYEILVAEAKIRIFRLQYCSELRSSQFVEIASF